MRLVGYQRVLVVLVGLMTGCFDQTPQQKAEDVCQAFCNCVVSPAQVESCIANDCLPDIPPVSDPCLDCVYRNSQTCSTLLDDCPDLCSNP